MAVVFNTQTGLAEQLTPEQAQSALQNGTHEVPLVDAEGNHFSAPQSEAAQYIQQGYTQPNSEQLSSMLEKAKFNSTSEQVKTFAESAAGSLSFEGSKLAEQALGVDPEDIRKREEYNPGISALGDAAGLTIGSLYGAGEAALLERAGANVAQKVSQYVGTNALGKIGTAAAKAAAENALYQVGDEAGKLFVEDPEQSAQTVISNVGLSAVLGGAIGGGLSGGAELWKLGPGKQIDNVLNTLKNKTSQIDESVIKPNESKNVQFLNGRPVDDVINELKSKAKDSLKDFKKEFKLEIDPEIEAAVSDSADAKKLATDLMNSGSDGALIFQEKVNKLKTDINNNVSSVFNKTKEDIENLSNLSEFELGKDFKQKLVQQIQKDVGPISEKLNKFKDDFKTALVTVDDKLNITNQITDLIEKEGLRKGPNKNAIKFVDETLEQLEMQKTAQDLENYIRGIGNTAKPSTDLYTVGKKLSSILRDAEENAIERTIGVDAPQLLNAFKTTKQEYGKFKNVLEELNSRLHLGKSATKGEKTFISFLSKMDPETLMNRLKLKGDVNLQNLLTTGFPKLSAAVKNMELNTLLKISKNNTTDALEIKKLFKNIDNLTPELKKHLITPEQLAKLDKIDNILKNIPITSNPSGTAKTLDRLWKKSPASVGAFVSMVMGSNPLFGYLIGKFSKWIGKEAPDATKVAMLKFMASGAPTNAQGFQAAVKMAGATIRAENALGKATKAIFQGTKPVITDPDFKDIEKLKKQVEEHANDFDKSAAVGENVGHYMPEHGTALAASAANVVQYLNTIKPRTEKPTALDKQPKVNKVAQAQYENALKIAQKPNIILKKLYEGTLMQSDVMHLANMYPGLYQNMRTKLSNQMIDAVDKKMHIPYKRKLTLSMMLGQPLEQSLLPGNMQSIQTSMSPQQQRQQMVKPTATGMSKLSKMPSNYMTPQQQRESYRTSGH